MTTNSDRILGFLPPAEDERHEFKGGATPEKELAEKIARAASAFWNSGGGRFVIGVDGSGTPDEGALLHVGRQSRRDWIDQAVARVTPVGSYSVEIEAVEVTTDRGIVAVTFNRSVLGPHMAPDNRYYVRGGAHTVPATHFIVEAIRAQRALLRPYLRARLRRDPNDPSHVQLLVLALNDAPSIDVHIALINPEGLHETYRTLMENFPLRVGVVDREHPFVMDYDALPYLAKPRLGDDAPRLELTYHDVVGNRYGDAFPLELIKSIGSLQIGSPPLERIARGVEQINKHLEALAKQDAT